MLNRTRGGVRSQPGYGSPRRNLAAWSEVDKTLLYHDLERVGSYAMLGRVALRGVTNVALGAGCLGATSARSA